MSSPASVLKTSTKNLSCTVESVAKLPVLRPPPPPFTQHHSWDKALHRVDEEVFHLRYKLDRQFLELSTDVRYDLLLSI